MWTKPGQARHDTCVVGCLQVEQASMDKLGFEVRLCFSDDNEGGYIEVVRVQPV